MRTYVDGTALCRFAGVGAEPAAWRVWVADRSGRLLTSSLALTQLRQAMGLADTRTRWAALDAAERIEVVGYSDQSLQVAAMAASVLSPFQALQLGIAVAHPDVDSMATYDRQLARVAVIHGLTVISPGRAEEWWLA